MKSLHGSWNDPRPEILVKADRHIRVLKDSVLEHSPGRNSLSPINTMNTFAGVILHL